MSLSCTLFQETDPERQTFSGFWSSQDIWKEAGSQEDCLYLHSAFPPEEAMTLTASSPGIVSMAIAVTLM